MNSAARKAPLFVVIDYPNAEARRWDAIHEWVNTERIVDLEEVALDDACESAYRRRKLESYMPERHASTRGVFIFAVLTVLAAVSACVNGRDFVLAFAERADVSSSWYLVHMLGFTAALFLACRWSNLIFDVVKRKCSSTCFSPRMDISV
eukprot:CAMPEP_0198728922 /NCGR_PEP_ID=MMETSP1475-20131203/12063_1 /TAXON_ID= ORGANISM="Unidentified sp., Strain CCMP1999" /NCGR_SAMPLE_ID=MMETSP1475 /ASSEMBLY_ACC=CAM_ASM_001111 /LENGTH=149 /DNA_ID=CAMNT_0044491401 /DNA_START=1 /DNA_END=450 /DNA_ORIENTATION=-